MNLFHFLIIYHCSLPILFLYFYLSLPFYIFKIFFISGLSLIVFTSVYSCLPMFTTVYSCLFTYVYP